MQPLKLKVELQDLPHKVSRTVLVPDNSNMRQLHFMIQESFDWWNMHLFEFKDKKFRPTTVVGMPDDFEMDFIGPEPKIAHKVELKDFILENGGKAFWYNYDFGDDWWHKISLQKLTEKDRMFFKKGFWCTKAVGKRPPEDVGGVHAYMEFLQAVKDQNHPDYEQYRTWAGIRPGEAYDENDVDLDKIVQGLAKLYHSDFWKADEYDGPDWKEIE